MTIVNSVKKEVEKFVDGKEDEDSPIGMIASYIDNINKKPPPVQMGLGGTTGLLTGYLFTKGSKATATVLGVSFVVFQFASYRGYIKLNRGKLEKNMRDLRRKKLYGKSQFEVDADQLGNFFSANAYLLGGFAAGCLLGYGIA